MATNINDSIKFWEDQERLDVATYSSTKTAMQTRAKEAAAAHRQNAGNYLPVDVINWCLVHHLTDQSNDAQIIEAVVDWITYYLYVGDHQAKKFYEYAEKYGLDEAIAWHADDVATEVGHNRIKTGFIKTVQHIVTQTPYAVPFINAVIKEGDVALREYAAQSVDTSTSAGHNLVNTFKHAGQRTGLRDILSACDFLRRVVRIWHWE